jgi:hypothetical protein
MEAAISSETPINIYQIKQQSKSEDSNYYIRRSENLKSHNILG